MATNETPDEQYNNMRRDLRFVLLQVENILNENKELKARNDELEKENEKLRETILDLCLKRVFLLGNIQNNFRDGIVYMVYIPFF